jgi:hypothetical protein
MKIQMDDFSKFANDRMTELANLDAWQEKDPKSDELMLDEKLVKITESALSDNQMAESDEEDNQSSFDIVEDFMSVATE